MIKNSILFSILMMVVILSCDKGYTKTPEQKVSSSFDITEYRTIDNFGSYVMHFGSIIDKRNGNTCYVIMSYNNVGISCLPKEK